MADMFRRVPKGNTTTANSTVRDNAIENSNRGRFRGRGGAFTRRPGRPRLTGAFADGIWLCDCEPRLPAEHFKVKKEGPNKGRWFYTCQNREGRRCGFFLWDDDVKPREEAAVLSKSRNEPSSTPAVFPARPEKSSTHVQQLLQNIQSSSSTASTLSQPPSSAQKRPFSDIDDDDDSFPWPLTGQEEAELAIIDILETPRKAVKTTALATPATSVPMKPQWLDYSSGVSRPATPAEETPSKPTPLLQLPTPSYSKHSVAQSYTSTNITPTPSRFRDALADAPSPQTNLTTSVFSALNASDVTLSTNLTSELRDILNRHELRTQSVSKGRDIIRLALKARDAKTVELQAKIASLEAEREVDRARIQRLEWEQSTLQTRLDPDMEGL